MVLNHHGNRDATLDELRADVKGAFGAGIDKVELLYVDEGEFQLAARAMLADGHNVTELRVAEGLPGGLIVVQRAADLPLDTTGTA